MKAPAHAHHHSRLGMALALLALLAQLWLGQVSTAHMAQMLVPAAMAADICTAQESPSLSASTSASASTQAPGHGSADALMNCPVCAVATTVAAADLWPHGSTAHPPQAADSFSNQPVAPRALRHASLYPPAQAPPRG